MSAMTRMWNLSLEKEKKLELFAYFLKADSIHFLAMKRWNKESVKETESTNEMKILSPDNCSLNYQPSKCSITF